MNRPLLVSEKDRSGFTLVELLAVIAVILILLAAVVPTVTSTLGGINLTTSGASLTSRLNQARQTALSRNVPVEVRFYKLPSASADPLTGAPSQYRAMQSFTTIGSATQSLDKVLYLANQIVLSPDKSKSSLLLLTEVTPASTQSIPIYKSNYRYVSFRYRPGGDADLAGANAFFTCADASAPLQTSGLPKNFLTIRIDPVSGRLTEFRP